MTFSKFRNKIKLFAKLLLQKLFGYDNYLFIFSLFTITKIRLHLQGKDFNHFLNLIPEDGYILDIGSNVGITAIPMAKRVSHGRVYCFEPISGHVRILKKIIRNFHLDNLVIFETALGNKSGELSMITPELFNVRLQGLSHIVEKEEGKIKGELYNVPVQKLDDILPLQNLPRIHAIKIDVENYEYFVLTGAENLLKLHKPIIYCEIWNNERKILTMQFLVDRLGYQVKVFVKDQWENYINQQASDFLFIC
jgi:FkbM family methyltransferase